MCKGSLSALLIARSLNVANQSGVGVARLPSRSPDEGQERSGAEESRTPDLCIANAALSQLSYRPRVIVYLYQQPSLGSVHHPAGKPRGAGSVLEVVDGLHNTVTITFTYSTMLMRDSKRVLLPRLS